MNNEKDIKLKNWTTELITLFGMWLWEKEEYGHGLLCITGPQWGYKIGHQLNIVWDDVIDYENECLLDDLYIQNNTTIHRDIVLLSKDYLQELFFMQNKINGTESIYINSKTGKSLSTSTLNRELKKFSEDFLKEMEELIGKETNLKPLKSNAFQIAWALKMVNKYNYSKKSFVAVSKFMGHRTLKDTINILEIKPNDEIKFDFFGMHSGGLLTHNTLTDSTKVADYFELAERPSWYNYLLK